MSVATTHTSYKKWGPPPAKHGNVVMQRLVPKPHTVAAAAGATVEQKAGELFQELSARLHTSAAHTEAMFVNAAHKLKSTATPKNPMQIIAELITQPLANLERILVDVVVRLAEIKYPALKSVAAAIEMVKRFVSMVGQTKLELDMSAGNDARMIVPLIDVQKMMDSVMEIMHSGASMGMQLGAEAAKKMPDFLKTILACVGAFFEKLKDFVLTSYKFLPAKWHDPVLNAATNLSGLFDFFRQLVSSYLSSPADPAADSIVQLLEPLITSPAAHVATPSPPEHAAVSGAETGALEYPVTHNDPFADNVPTTYHENPLPPQQTIFRRYAAPSSFALR